METSRSLAEVHHAAIAAAAEHDDLGHDADGDLLGGFRHGQRCSRRDAEPYGAAVTVTGKSKEKGAHAGPFQMA